MTITAKELREHAGNAAKTGEAPYWVNLLASCADTIEELGMELVCRPAKVEVAKCDLKSNFMDFYATHPKLDYKSSQKEEWEAIYRHAPADMESAYNDGQYSLCAIQQWRASDPKEREKAKRKALFLEALKRWGFAAGVEHARDWWDILKTRGDVNGVLDDMITAVNWIGRRCSERSVSITFANQAVVLIDEYRQSRQ